MAVALVLAMLSWLAAAPEAAGAATPSPASPIVGARPLSIAEAAAVQSRAGTLAVATNGILPGPPTVTAWTRPPGSAVWSTGTTVQPAGFAASYDPGVAAMPDGRLILSGVAAGNAPGACLPGGSVYVAATKGHGLDFASPVVVDDRRGGGGFDDRPFVAAGPDGTLWVAWSHGPLGQECEIIGSSDQVQVSHSRDGARSFSTPVTLPKLTSGPAFGVQVAPIGKDQAAVSWAELGSDGQVTVVVSLVRADGSFAGPRVVAVDTALPSVLPGPASFFSFSLPSLVSFDAHHDLALTWPVWKDQAAHLVVAVSRDLGATWSTTTVAPSPGTDLLLPALADNSQGLRLLFAVHTRADDAVGYASAEVGIDPARGAPVVGTPSTVIASQPGPGFKELGEFLLLSSSADQVVGAVVNGGPTAATLDFLSWPVAGRSPEAATSGAEPPAGTNPAAVSSVTRPHHALTWLGVLVAVLLLALGTTIALAARSRGAHRRGSKRYGRTNMSRPLAGRRPASIDSHEPHTSRHPQWSQSTHNSRATVARRGTVVARRVTRIQEDQT